MRGHSCKCDHGLLQIMKLGNVCYLKKYRCEVNLSDEFSPVCKLLSVSPFSKSSKVHIASEKLGQSLEIVRAE